MSSNQNSHPSIEEFKAFVKEHPKLIQEVRENKRSWQQIFEEWHILGEDDDIWKKYKRDDGDKKDQSNTDERNEKSNNDFMTQFLSILKNIDTNELQQNISNINGAISNVQQLISQFQSFKQSKQQPNDYMNPYQHSQNGPFSYRKD